MATLSGDVKVWSLREDVVVRDVDLAAVRYQDKSSVSKERVYYDEKKRYIESRGGCVAPKNSRPTRLRDALKEFEELLSVEQVVWSGWGCNSSLPPPAEGDDDSMARREEPCRVYYLVLSSGVVCTALVSAVTGDLRSLASDKYMAGKLLSEHPAHAVITASHLVISYNDARLSVLHLDSYTPPSVLVFPHPPAGGPSTPSMASRHPSLYTAQLAGPHGRRFQRRLSANTSGQMIAVWWERSEDEVYPWSPLERDCRDRANILIYSLRCGQLSLVGHARSHLPPLSVAFSTRDANVLLSVEQGFDKKGGVTVLSVVYKVDQTSEKSSGVERVSVTSIPLEAPVTCHSYSPQEDRLFLACNNGVLALHSHASTHLTRAALSPTHVTWLQPGALLAVANDRGQVQIFDMALSLVRVQLGGEDGVPVRLLDFAEYFCHQPSLRHIAWAPAPVVYSSRDSKRSANVKRYLDVREQHSSLLLMLHYSRGPLVCLRFNAPHFSLTHPVCSLTPVAAPEENDSDFLNTSHASNSSSATKSSGNADTTDSSDIIPSGSDLTSHYCSISPDVLVGEYLRHGQVEEAINLSRSLCWEQDGGAALKCISNVVNYVIRRRQLTRSCGPGLFSTPPGGATPEEAPQQEKDMGDNSSPPPLGLWETRVLSAASVLSAGFLTPSTTLSTATEEFYGPPVRALARRLFFRLLRCGSLHPAYSLAKDLGDPDCFVRLHRAALKGNCPQLAAQALQRAHSLRRSSVSGSSSSSSCSESCSGSDWSEGSSGSSSCCSEDCSHSSYSGSSSCSDSCSTCSDTSEGSDSDDAPAGRGERQGGDGRESEGTGNARPTDVSITADDARDRRDRPLYIQQSTNFPPPVPAPILPGMSNSSPLDSGNSTITYYDPVPQLPSTSAPYSSPASANYSSTTSYLPHASISGEMLPQTSSVFSNSHIDTDSSIARSAVYGSADPSTGEKFVPETKSSSAAKSPTPLINERNLKSSDLHFDDRCFPDRPPMAHGAHNSNAYGPSLGHQPGSNQGSNARNVDGVQEFCSNSIDRNSISNATLGVSNSMSQAVHASGAPTTNSVGAITSQDGKVTINITQDNSHKSPHSGSRHHKSKSKRNEVPPIVDDAFQLENKGVGDRKSSSFMESTSLKPVQHGSSKHRHHQKKPDIGGISFRTRKSQRNLMDAMDAADSAIAALNSSRETKFRADENEPEIRSSFQDPKTSRLTDASLCNEALAAPGPGFNNGSQMRCASNEYSKCLQNSAAQEVGYYNEDTIDEELNRSMYQELSTEEEEGGGTVKVVHFGVV